MVNKTNILGIDIGGSIIKGAPVNIKKGVLSGHRLEVPTPEVSTPKVVIKTCAEMAGQFNWKGSIGFTYPGVIKKGIALSAANIDKSWIGINGEKMLAEQMGCPVLLLNDADAAGIAEMNFGSGKNQKGVVILLTLGTGIGSAIFIDGKLVPNTEFGHMEVRGKDAEHRAAARIRIKENLSWEDWADNLNEVLNRMEVLFSPDLFILGGGVSQNHTKFLPLLNTTARIVPAQMGNDAGIIGAAMAAGRKFAENNP